MVKKYISVFLSLLLMLGACSHIAESSLEYIKNPLQNNVRVDSIRHGPLPPPKISICGGLKRKKKQL